MNRHEQHGLQPECGERELNICQSSRVNPAVEQETGQPRQNLNRHPARKEQPQAGQSVIEESCHVFGLSAHVPPHATQTKLTWRSRNQIWTVARSSRVYQNAKRRSLRLKRPPNRMKSGKHIITFRV